MVAQTIETSDFTVRSTENSIIRYAIANFRIEYPAENYTVRKRDRTECFAERWKSGTNGVWKGFRIDCLTRLPLNC